MTEDAVELWLPGRGDALPECLLGRPLLVAPHGESFFELVTSSVWTPLTWSDCVRAVAHPEGGYTVTELAAAGPYVRVVVTYDPSIPALRARTIVHSWRDLGAAAIEVLPGLFTVAWSEDRADAIDAAVAEAGPGFSIVERWESAQRTPSAVREHLRYR